MKRKFSSLIAFIVYGIAYAVAPAQIATEKPTESLLADSKFFETTAVSRFEDWLTRSNLSTILAVGDVATTDTYVVLRLELLSDDPESAALIWESSQQIFEANSKFSLPYTLHRKMTYYFEVDNKFAVLEIFDSIDPLEEPCYYVRISYTDELGVDESSCRTQTAVARLGEIEIRDDLSFITQSKSVRMPEISQRRAFLSSIYDQAKRYFEDRTSEADVRLLELGRKLTFEVRNAKNEVFPPESFDFLSPHEYLMITVDFENDTESLIIRCFIDGKIGSGMFKPRKSVGYREMEPKYAADLQLYTAAFVNENLVRWISQPVLVQ